MTAPIGFSEMRVFVAVVTNASFTAAAQRLDTDKARVSRIVQRIEEKLGARLLNRSTRRLSVTEVGRDYFERASSILAAAEAAEAAVAHQHQEPQGRLKITATPEFGTTRVDNWIAAYLKLWPKVAVETVYSSGSSTSFTRAWTSPFVSAHCRTPIFLRGSSGRSPTAYTQARNIFSGRSRFGPSAI
jgi:LysR family transcriptional regulator, regulator for bpeEF and oprC